MKTVGKFFRLKQQKFPLNAHLGFIFREVFETNFWNIVFRFMLYPIGTKLLEVFFECQSATSIFFGMNPSVSFCKNVVVRDAKEMIAILSIPIGDHFRVIVSIAPKRVCMEISLPPFGFFCGYTCRAGQQQHNAICECFHVRDLIKIKASDYIAKP